MKTSLLRARPHLWYQLYWVSTSSGSSGWTSPSPTRTISSTARWTTSSPSTSVHLSLRQLVLPAGGRHGAALVVRHRQLRQALSDDVLGHDLLLILYMVLPNGLDIRPTVEEWAAATSP